MFFIVDARTRCINHYIINYPQERSQNPFPHCWSTRVHGTVTTLATLEIVSGLHGQVCSHWLRGISLCGNWLTSAPLPWLLGPKPPNKYHLENEAAWVPYGYHVMTIGVSSENGVLVVPMCYDNLLQSTPQTVRNEIIAWNTDIANNQPEKKFKGFGVEQRRLLSRAA